MKRIAITFIIGLTILLASIWFSAYTGFMFQGSWFAAPLQWTCTIFGIIGVVLITFGPALNSWIEVEE